MSASKQVGGGKREEEFLEGKRGTNLRSKDNEGKRDGEKRKIRGTGERAHKVLAVKGHPEFRTAAKGKKISWRRISKISRSELAETAGSRSPLYAREKRNSRSKSEKEKEEATTLSPTQGPTERAITNQNRQWRAGRVVVVSF